MKDFKKLKVWQKSHDLTLDLYKATKQFPKEELYGLTSQIRRASSSVAANITEGCGRRSDAELARFLNIALGSASELEYHLILARDLEYLSENLFKQLVENTKHLKQMLATFIRKLKTER